MSRAPADGLGWADCLDWTLWSSALGIYSAAGRYIIEYIFFVVFSVRSSYLFHSQG